MGGVQNKQKVGFSETKKQMYSFSGDATDPPADDSATTLAAEDPTTTTTTTTTAAAGDNL